MITLEKAKRALKASEEKAKGMGIAVSTVIVDEHGSVIAVSRMDGAIPISPKFAYSKAYTSASLGLPSEDLGEGAKEGKPYYGINTLFGGKLTPMAGGLPLMVDKKLAGGVGVGGSYNTQEDAECAKAALKELS